MTTQHNKHDIFVIFLRTFAGAHQMRVLVLVSNLSVALHGTAVPSMNLVLSSKTNTIQP